MLDCEALDSPLGRTLVSDLARAAAHLTRDEFLARYDRPLLVPATALPARPSRAATTRATRETPTPLGVRPQLKGDGTRHLYELRKRPGGNRHSSVVTLGRAWDNDLVVPDDTVSRFHASFSSDRTGTWWLTESGRNGTWVDGVRLDPRRARPLAFGARLTFGRVEMAFVHAGTVLDLLRELGQRRVG